VRFGVVIAGMAQLKAGIVPFGLRLIAAIMSNRTMEFSDTPQGEAPGPSLRRFVAGKSSLPRSVVSL
jgi:hypothetical protein